MTIEAELKTLLSTKQLNDAKLRKMVAKFKGGLTSTIQDSKHHCVTEVTDCGENCILTVKYMFSESEWALRFKEINKYWKEALYGA